MSQLSTYPLRLLRSIRAGVGRVSRQGGTSVNQFVSITAEEKLAMLEAETLFTERAARADLAAFDELMQRKSGAAPQDGDQI